MNQGVISPTLRATDLFPAEVLKQPLPLDAYWQALYAFAKIAVPCALVIVGALIALDYCFQNHAPWWVIAVLIFGTCFLVGMIIVSYLVLEKTFANYERRQLTYHHAVSVAGIVAQNLTVNHVTVSGKSNTVNLNQQQHTETVLDGANTQVYDVALEIAKRAIHSWMRNGGKRERPKPFSAQIMSKELEIGGETWQAAMELIEAAGVLRNGTSPTGWSVTIIDPKQAENSLAEVMRRRGFSSTWTNGEQGWYKVINPPTLNG